MAFAWGIFINGGRARRVEESSLRSHMAPEGHLVLNRAPEQTSVVSDRP